MTLIRLFFIAKLDKFPTKYMNIPFDAYNIYRFALSILFFGGVIWSAEWKCKEDTQNGLLVADCSNQKKDVHIPDNLNPNIQVLNLSGNTFVHCANDSFNRYRNLISLDLSNSYIKKRVIDIYCFAPLVNLASLNLDFTCLPDSVNVEVLYYFPANIRVLRYSNCTAIRVNLTSILELEEFVAANSFLFNFPTIYTLAPLKRVDLGISDLKKFKPEQTAPFCLLEELRVQIGRSDGIQEPELYCECVNANSWFNKTGLKYDKLNCTSEEPNPPTCPANFTEANKIREACFKRIARAKLYSLILLIVAILSVPLIVLSMVLIFIFLRRRKSKEGETESGKAPSQAEDEDTAEENTPEETTQSEVSEAETEQ